MRTLPLLLLALSGALLAATWIAYPIWLRQRARVHRRTPWGLAGGGGGAGGRGGRGGRGLHPAWPTVTIVVVVRNADATLPALLRNLLALAYPADLRRILVVSNASDDFTDAVTRLFAHRGVELLRVLRPRRSVAAAENFARRWVESDLVVVVRPDARLHPSALAALVEPFADPTVGVAFGREVRAELTEEGARIARPLMGRYEAWLRDLETRVFGTVSARRSLYAVRTALYRTPVAATSSPDFAPILTARERGFRAVYAGEAEAVILGDGVRALRGHYAELVKTVTRDATALLAKPHLLNPRRYGAFAWILLGHKLGRWLSPWAALGAVVALLLLSPAEPWARIALGLAAALGLDAAITWNMPVRSPWGRLAASPGRVAAASVATAQAMVLALGAGEPLLAGAPARLPLRRRLLGGRAT